MLIDNLFDRERVLEIEREVLTKVQTSSTLYFKEEVAQYLYRAWQQDNKDTRIVEYCMPLIQSLMVSRVKLISLNKLEPLEVFNQMAYHILRVLPNYNKDLGKLYTYFNQRIPWWLHDMFEEEKGFYVGLEPNYNLNAITINYESLYMLEDFKVFIRKIPLSLELNEDNRTLFMVCQTFQDLLKEDKINFTKQTHIISAICKRSGLKRPQVKMVYRQILRLYNPDILDE